MRNPAEAYAQTAKAAETDPRQRESALLVRAAVQLQRCKDDWKGFDPALDQALLYNRKLWTVLSTSATDNANPLPQEVKNNVASLAVFIFRRTLDVMADPAPEKLDALISINRDLAAGLGTRPAAAVPATATAGLRASA